ncbi:hypothetical protein ACT3UJ_02455 [Halomonas sp. 86]|uniref:hypothetical protein n=1 Tax=unclassified Halomonas TaxID=2609666 RepID=UPI004034044E
MKGNAQHQYTYAFARRDGAILSVITGVNLYIEIEDGADVIDVTHYVDVETREIKDKQPLAYEVDNSGLTVTLTDLPSGLAVEANGQRAITDSEPLVITFDVPGTYRIELSGLVEYLNETLEVTVDDT